LLDVQALVPNLAAFAIAAFLEIAGCFAFWMWLRQGRSPLVAVVGIASLIGFAAVLTRVDAGFAGRAYAAYGGIYIGASLAWLWGVEGQRPTTTDLAGALLAVIGAVIIIGAAARRPF
jgi:small multidrug resistance family-3 protein